MFLLCSDMLQHVMIPLRGIGKARIEKAELLTASFSTANYVAPRKQFATFNNMDV